MKKLHKLPRLYTNQTLTGNGSINLEPGTAHYLKTVIRKKIGDQFRTFNGKEGEYLAEISELNKKNGTAKLLEIIKEQPEKKHTTHLLFSPIKKQRMDFLIEKSVELGVTDLHPVITARCEARKINTDRLRMQIIEASEQCERLDIAILYPSQKLENIVATWNKSIPLYACLERLEAQKIQNITTGNSAFLIGPEGGFNDQEIEFLKAQKTITPISLGTNILRSETAALTCMALAHTK